MNIRPLLCVLSLGLAFVACKPKENVLSGQVFIANGNQNVKLSLVEVQLIPKTLVIEFLNQNLVPLETEISKRRIEFEDAEKEAKIASDEKQHFSTNNPYTAWVAKWPLRPDYPSREGIQAAKIAEKETHDREMELSDKLAAAISRRDSAVFASEHFPQPETYFENSSFPKGIQKVLTDADGKFLLKYPNDQAFALFAKWERTLDGGSAKCFWLIDAPANGGPAQILLSNHNLVYSDPDGYFKIKPKL